GAENHRLRRQMDVIDLRDLVGPGFKTEPGVVEITDRKYLQSFRVARPNAQPSVIDLAADMYRVALDFAEQHAVAAIMRQPAEDDAVASGRVRHREPVITAGVFIGREQAGGAERGQCRSRFAKIYRRLERTDGSNRRRRGGSVANG